MQPTITSSESVFALKTRQAEGYKLLTHDVAISPSYFSAHLPVTPHRQFHWSRHGGQPPPIGRAPVNLKAMPLRID